MQLRSTVEGSNRVLRGGSWNNNESNCRVANRNNNNPDNRNNNYGFRLVLVPAHRHSRIAATEQIVVLFPAMLWNKEYKLNYPISSALKKNVSKIGYIFNFNMLILKLKNLYNNCHIN